MAADLPHSRHFAVVQEPGALLVRDRRRVAPALVGLPFLVTAAYLWYGAWLILASHARAGSLGTPSGYLPMVAFLLPAGALFAWPGVRLSLYNRQVRFVQATRTVELIDDFVALRRRRERPLADFRAVTLRRILRTSRTSSDGKSTSGSHRSLAIDLLPADSATRHARVAFEYDVDTLRPLAARVASYTGLPLEEALTREYLE